MKKWLALFAVLLLVNITGGCTYTYPDSHIIVIDAGSSGSRIYIYRVTDGIYEGLPFVTSVAEPLKVEPGISQLDESPVQVLNGLGQLMKYAQNHIDKDLWASTPLHLMATAGMRLETADQQRESMEMISTFLRKSPFHFQEATIISGQYEGLYAWIAINYLDDVFDPDQGRESMLEMGGASTQYAYLTDSTDTSAISRTYRGEDYHILAKSYLRMGQDQAFEHTSTPNCFPKGYVLDNGVVGTGDFATCAIDIVSKFNGLCKLAPHPECLFDQEVTLSTEDPYMALSAFYYTFDFLGFDGELTMKELKQKGSDFCALTWDEVKNKYGEKSPEKYLKTYCYFSSYFWALLEQGYHFDENMKVNFTDKIQSQDPSWTWGAAIDLAMGNRPAPFVNP